jgi:hypothetical protein
MAAGVREAGKTALQQLATATEAAAGGEPKLAEVQAELSAANEELQAAMAKNENLKRQLDSLGTSEQVLQAELKGFKDSNKTYFETRQAEKLLCSDKVKAAAAAEKREADGHKRLLAAQAELKAAGPTRTSCSASQRRRRPRARDGERPRCRQARGRPRCSR